MKKIDSTVLKETIYIAWMTLILSALMQSVFLIVGKWDYAVLLGNLLGYLTAVGNFLLLGITVQKAVEKEEKEAKQLIKFSQSMRMVMLFAVTLAAYLISKHVIPIFNIIAVVIPFLFPRIAITFRPLFNKKG